MQLNHAKQIAANITDTLLPHTERLHIAGSVRRQKSEVHDIEFCCTPKKIFIPTDLFGEGYKVTAPGFIQAIDTLAWKVIKGRPDGRMMQIELKEQHINLDLFMPELYDYYRIYAIRTGSADYSQKVLAGGWRAKGWVGTSEGLRLMKDCVETPSGWKLCNKAAEKPPEWESEEDFFDWLGLKWKEPKEREVKERNFNLSR